MHSNEHPFASAPAVYRKPWALGIRVGEEAVSRAAGAAAVKALVAAELEATKQQLLDQLAQRTAVYDVLHAATQKREEAIAACRERLLPESGEKRIGKLHWAVSWFYLLLSVGAALGELPLALGTIIEQIPDITSEKLNAIRAASAWGLAGIICLIGFSIKLLVDVQDEQMRFRWWHKTAVFIALAFSAISIGGVAALREAQDQLNAALSQSDPAVRRDATREVAERSAFTFRWMTLTLPCFAAAALLVSLHQKRAYGRHNAAVSELARLTTLQEEQVREQLTIQHQKENWKKEIEMLEGANSEVWSNAQRAYELGVEEGARVRGRRVLGGDLGIALDDAVNGALKI